MSDIFEVKALYTLINYGLQLILDRETIHGKSSESVQCAMLKVCDACTDMGQL